ncbi:hypothetical protein AgCh_021103 [Apium graveolens]
MTRHHESGNEAGEFEQRTKLGPDSVTDKDRDSGLLRFEKGNGIKKERKACRWRTRKEMTSGFGLNKGNKV